MRCSASTLHSVGQECRLTKKNHITRQRRLTAEHGMGKLKYQTEAAIARGSSTYFSMICNAFPPPIRAELDRARLRSPVYACTFLDRLVMRVQDRERSALDD